MRYRAKIQYMRTYFALMNSKTVLDPLARLCEKQPNSVEKTVALHHRAKIERRFNITRRCSSRENGLFSILLIW